VIDITAAIAIGGAGDGGKWTMAPRKRWFGLCQAADGSHLHDAGSHAGPDTRVFFESMRPLSLSSKGIGEAEKQVVLIWE
jgi:hypothetical protein